MTAAAPALTLLPARVSIGFDGGPARFSSADMRDMALSNFIGEALLNPTDYISYSVSERLARMFSGKSIIEGDGDLFDVEEYARAGHCTVVGERSLHNQFSTTWQGAELPLRQDVENAWFNVLWQGQLLDVVYITWTESGYRSRFHWIIADTREAAEKFFGAVCEWNSEVRGEILVFDGGYWQKSKELYRSIAEASFDNLILPEALKEEVRGDLPRFIASRELYGRYGVPWKRGLLLIGPPGNGKTHAVKAMINELKLPCLYVKSLDSCSGEHASIRWVFERARRAQPCVVVLEDIDSLIHAKNRSFFLNEMDGFAANTGVVVVATTNHPERLDTSILDRPSRFDRKFYFELPAEAERLGYVRAWNQTLQEEMRLSEAGVTDAVARTEGFSFAYLKELFLSAMMQWIGAGLRRTMDEVVSERAAHLREQMSNTNEECKTEEDAGAAGEH